MVAAPVVVPVEAVVVALLPVTALTSDPTVFSEFTKLVRFPIDVVLPVPLRPVAPNACRAVVKPLRLARGLASKRAEKSRVRWFPVLLVVVVADAEEGADV
jgi:hypothetical protein